MPEGCAMIWLAFIGVLVVTYGLTRLWYWFGYLDGLRETEAAWADSERRRKAAECQARAWKRGAEILSDVVLWDEEVTTRLFDQDAE